MLSSNIPRNWYCSRASILFNCNEVAEELFFKCQVMPLQGKQSNIVTSRGLKPITDLGPFPPRARWAKYQFLKVPFKPSPSYFAITHVSITMVSMVFKIFLTVHISCSFSEPMVSEFEQYPCLFRLSLWQKIPFYLWYVVDSRIQAG